MKPEGSSLNPRATSYIPPTNREGNKTDITENSSNESIGEPHLHNPPFDNLSPSLNTGRGQNAPVAVASPVNNPPARGSVSQHSNELSKGEKFKQDLRYLLDNFCKLSKEYLTDVYLENERDLQATLDMLKQLQIKPESLPDSLGIGDSDTSESESAAVGQPSSLESGSSAVGRPSSKKNVAKGSSSSSKFC